jgi:hypothetical protein
VHVLIKDGSTDFSRQPQQSCVNASFAQASPWGRYAHELNPHPNAYFFLYAFFANVHFGSASNVQLPASKVQLATIVSGL